MPLSRGLGFQQEGDAGKAALVRGQHLAEVHVSALDLVQGSLFPGKGHKGSCFADLEGALFGIADQVSLPGCGLLQAIGPIGQLIGGGLSAPALSSDGHHHLTGFMHDPLNADSLGAPIGDGERGAVQGSAAQGGLQQALGIALLDQHAPSEDIL